MLEEQINKDYIQAMKAKDSVKSSTLNFLRAQIKNLRIEKRADQLSDDDVVSVLKKQVKQRQDSIEQYKQGGREDLAAKETAECEILSTYLPKQLSEEEVGKFVDEAIQETSAASMKDMGNVMKAVLAKVGSSADNKMVSTLVKTKLSQL
ncbi:MAG: GatB/YqeY domain-containing protein [Candidatus Omnitrophica bacterium]|nr:GatB/YqeY domain-containing protein [Candidatus Omnitrophota bacterium]